ncbi:serine hydrolase [Yeosuana marina]|uniref:serine hydrolase n=1 Tax=Yeosuana marina TaxID=1565536 RepID=UPI0030EEA3AC|tara:strand:- start:8231 stop:9796 length:1566 start_codon:yes stop_codon:yes gene_type:complete
MKLKRVVITTLFLVIYNATLFAQLSNTQIDSLVNNAMETFNVAGSAVAIVKDGKVIYEKGFGVKSKLTNEPVNEHTNFAIASNSKAFTTAALAMLVEEGKLKWTDRVVDHIPEFTMYNAYVKQNFNIQDLLTHRSGLGLGMGDLMFFPDGSDFTIDDLLASFQHFKPMSAFRTKWDYDNLLYIVAGELIKRASGMTWEEFIKTRIFEPLKMDNSYASSDEIENKNNLASPHNGDSGVLKVLPDFEHQINGAAGGICSNVDDISQWMLLQLNKGKYGENLENQLFTEKSQREMWKIHTTQEASKSPRYTSHFAGYGLGWFLTDKLGNMEVSHTGGLPGMLSKTLLIPDLNLGVVVLTNTEPGGAGLFSAVTSTIEDSYLGLDDFQWTDKWAKVLKSRGEKGDEVSKNAWETVKANKNIKVDETKYIGLYKDSWFGTMEVFKNGNQLWIKSHRSPKLNGPMYFYNANTFAIKWEYQDMNCDAFAMFSLDENGLAQSIKMKGISPNIDFSFDFHDLDLQRIKND